jgi:hypothetical protein
LQKSPEQQAYLLSMAEYPPLVAMGQELADLEMM